MFAFCFTIPFGALILLGGLIGFIVSSSIPSLIAGGGVGISISLLGFSDLSVSCKEKSRPCFHVLNLLTCAMLWCCYHSSQQEQW